MLQKSTEETTVRDLIRPQNPLSFFAYDDPDVLKSKMADNSSKFKVGLFAPSTQRVLLAEACAILYKDIF